MIFPGGGITSKNSIFAPGFCKRPIRLIYPRSFIYNQLHFLSLYMRKTHFSFFLCNKLLKDVRFLRELLILCFIKKCNL